MEQGGPAPHAASTRQDRTQSAELRNGAAENKDNEVVESAADAAMPMAESDTALATTAFPNVPPAAASGANGSAIPTPNSGPSSRLVNRRASSHSSRSASPSVDRDSDS